MIYYFKKCCLKFDESDNFFGVNGLTLTTPILGNVYAITIPSFSGCATLIQGPIPSGSLIYDAGNGNVVLYPDCSDCIESAYSCFPPPPPQPAITYIQSNECDVITVFPMTVECEVINPSSYSASDGRASISITGGTPPYTVTWADGSVSPAIMDLEIGSYPATIVDYWEDFTANTICVLSVPKPTATQTPTPTPTPTTTPTKTLTPTPTQTLTPTSSTPILPPYGQTFTMIARSLNSFSIVSGIGFRIVTSQPFRVVWGDGNTTNYPSGTINISHTYTTPYTGNILIQTSNLASITSLLPANSTPQMGQNTTRYLEIQTSQLNLLTGLLSYGTFSPTFFTSGNINLLPPSLVSFQSNFTNCSGNVANLPNGLQYLLLDYLDSSPNQSNNLSGNVSDLPSTLTDILLGGNNTIMGNVGDFPPLITQIQINGQNTITGDISLMSTPNLTRFLVYGNNTIFGDLGGLSNSVTDLTLFGQNTVTGDISTLPPNPTRLDIRGNNTLYGNIGTLNYTTLNDIIIMGNNIISGNINGINLKVGASLNLEGNNTVTGDISGLGNSNIYQRLYISGNNTISGNIQNLPSNSRNVTILGNNTISGDLSLVHLNIVYLVIRGNNTISTFSNSSRIFTSLSQIEILGSGLNSTNINNLLTSYASSTWSGIKLLKIKGTSTPKYTNITSYNTLQTTKGVVITIS